MSALGRCSKCKSETAFLAASRQRPSTFIRNSWWSDQTTPKIASANTAWAKKPTAKASVRKTGIPSV